MKRAAIAILAIIAAVGCHGQVPPNPIIYTCPATTGTIYQPLNQSTPATGLTYSWTPAAGTYCVIAQSVLGSATSVPSNTAGPVTATGTIALVATWSAPATGPTPSGYVLSMAPAIQQTLGAPALNPAVAWLVKLLDAPENALLAPAGLTLKGM